MSTKMDMPQSNRNDKPRHTGTIRVRDMPIGNNKHDS